MNKEVKSITKEQIQKEVSKVTGDEDINSKENQIGQILLTSLEKGPNEKKIAEFLSLDEDFVKIVGKRLRKNGVWTDEEVICGWFGKTYGGIAFNMDICVGMGLVERK